MAALTLGFYRRNYIEGLFLSSGIIRSPDYTMESLVRIARTLRQDHGFKGYIHLKTIPNASPELQAEAGLYADRLSINIELPTPASLTQFAPDKNLEGITGAMHRLRDRIGENREDRKLHRHTPVFAPGGQSTQMIVGADTTDDGGILRASTGLYRDYGLRRVYYSAFTPIPQPSRLLPARPAPLLREHRLYQADWLYRFYGFSVDDILSATTDNMLDLTVDPKLAYALRHRHLFPVDLNRADRHLLLRVPGLGVTSVSKILEIRHYHRLRWGDLVRLRVPVLKIKPFVVVADYHPPASLADHAALKTLLAPPVQRDLFAALEQTG